MIYSVPAAAAELNPALPLFVEGSCPCHSARGEPDFGVCTQVTGRLYVTLSSPSLAWVPQLSGVINKPISKKRSKEEKGSRPRKPRLHGGPTHRGSRGTLD